MVCVGQAWQYLARHAVSAAYAGSSVLPILLIGAIMCRTRSQSGVARSAVACDAEAEGRSALDGDLGRLKAGAPGGWPSAVWVRSAGVTVVSR